jgi:hypothetical protein
MHERLTGTAVHPRPQRDSPVTALVVAILGAVTIMVSPITPWQG